MRLYDRTHAGDPYRLLHRELHAGWDFDMDVIRFRHREGNKVTPEVYVDDRRTWLINFVLTPNSKICRVELYEPPPEYFDLPAEMRFAMVPFQLRAYTCEFMSRVATGVRTMRRKVNFGDLIAGPGGFDNMNPGGEG